MPKGYRYEVMLRKELEKNGFLVIRSAGSFFIDLICIRNGEVCLIEIKSSRNKTHYLSKRCREQLKELKKAEAYGAKSFYAVWFKNKGWKIIKANPEIKKVELDTPDVNNLFISQK